MPGADVAASALAAKLLVHGELLPVGRGRDFADACSPNDQDGEEAFGGQLEPFFHAGFDFRLVVGVGGDDVCALALEGLVKPEGIGLPGEVAGRGRRRLSAGHGDPFVVEHNLEAGDLAEHRIAGGVHAAVAFGAVADDAYAAAAASGFERT